jgi:hypothetical protein
MRDILNFFLIFMLVPGILGVIFARNRGRNVFGWGALSALFPFALVILYFNKPLREIKGGFKLCSGCGNYISWSAPTCKYCTLAHPPRS